MNDRCLIFQLAVDVNWHDYAKINLRAEELNSGIVGKTRTMHVDAHAVL